MGMTDEPKYRNEEWLREQYQTRSKTTREIAAVCDCSKTTVRKWLYKHDIQVKTAARQAADERLANSSWLERQYVDRKQSLSDIADICDCHTGTVGRWLDRHGIERCGIARSRADKRLADRDWLKNQYVKQEKRCAEIADICDCAEITVYGWLDRHEIETDPGQRLMKYEQLTDATWLREQYVEQEKGLTKIAEEVGCSISAVTDWLGRHGIETREWPGGVTGEDHPNWNGGERPYGPGWNERKRQAVRSRDNHTCQDPRCSVTQGEHLNNHGEKLHVHHLRKAREIEDAEQRNAKSNLITLCRECHRRWEKIADTGLVPQLGGTQATLGEVTDDE
jgi:transposase